MKIKFSELPQRLQLFINIGRTVVGDEKFRYALDKTIKNFERVYHDEQKKEQDYFDKEYLDMHAAFSKEKKELIEAMAIPNPEGAGYVWNAEKNRPQMSDDGAYDVGEAQIMLNHNAFFVKYQYIEKRKQEHQLEEVEVEIYSVYEDNFPFMMTLEQQKYMCEETKFLSIKPDHKKGTHVEPLKKV